MKAKKKSENTFETGLETLTQIADRLETGELGLDESLRAFEDGVRLYRQLQEQLENARLKIETIIAENDADKKPVEGAESDEF